MLWEMIMNKGNFTMTEEIFRSNADYHNLKCYQKSVIIYDGTYFFCRRFLASGDRTIDQMVQAARSGKQNIVEGVMAWNTSSETMLKLLGVAKASLEELREDYQDYLRTRNLPLWEKDSRPAAKVRRLGKLPGGSADIFRDYMMNRSDGTCANIMICLIHQCSYLIARLQQSAMVNFAREGGFREKLSRIRQKNLQEQSSKQYRKRQYFLRADVYKTGQTEYIGYVGKYHTISPKHPKNQRPQITHPPSKTVIFPLKTQKNQKKIDFFRFGVLAF